MIKAVATGASRKYNLKIKEVHRVVNEGEIIDLSEERFYFLNGNNPYGVKFFLRCDDDANIEEVKEQPSHVVKDDVAVPSQIEAEVEEEEPEVVVIKPKKKSTKKVSKEAE